MVQKKSDSQSEAELSRLTKPELVKALADKNSLVSDLQADKAWFVKNFITSKLFRIASVVLFAALIVVITVFVTKRFMPSVAPELNTQTEKEQKARDLQDKELDQRIKNLEDELKTLNQQSEKKVSQSEQKLNDVIAENQKKNFSAMLNS